MNKETRIKKIQEVCKQKPISSKKIIWKDDPVYMDIYKIPLDYLVYNKYNGRIKSRVKSLEKQGKKIDVSTASGKKDIEDLLWYSKKAANAITKIDIAKNGQLQVGIITRDGIIIDGNRRAMLLNRIDKYDYFEGVILPTTIEENKREIRKLETSYQMGEDKKLDYNPIEKYLTVKDSVLEGDEIKEIAEWMGEQEIKIKEWIDVMKIMDDYLDYLGYNGIYTQLYGREGQFVDFTKWLNNFYGGDSTKAFDGYKDSDVDDLKIIAFDYIRAKYEGKKFRYLAQGQKQSHFFGNRKIWESFRNKHFKNVEPIQDKENNINLDSENLTTSLNDRDDKFKSKAQKLLEDNLDVHYTKLRNIQAQDEPIKLVSRAIDSISAINRRGKNFEKPEVLDQVEKLNQATAEMLQEKSPKRALRQIVDLLISVEIKKNIDEKEVLLEEIKKINKLSFEIKKKLGG